MFDHWQSPPKATVGRHVLTGNVGAAGGLPPPLSPRSPRPDDFFQQDSSSNPRLYFPLFSTSPLLDVRLSDNDCDLDFFHEGEGRYTTRTDNHPASMWSGARSDGRLRGQALREPGSSKPMFEVRILDEIEVHADPQIASLSAPARRSAPSLSKLVCASTAKPAGGTTRPRSKQTEAWPP